MCTCLGNNERGFTVIDVCGCSSCSDLCYVWDFLNQLEVVRIMVPTPWYSVGPRRGDAVPSNFSSFFFIMNGHHIYVFNFAI